MRFGHLAVVVAQRLGWDKLEAEIVFPVEWLKDDTAPVTVCDDLGSYKNNIFPSRTDAQRRASAKLSQLLKGQEEKYPILVIDDTQSDADYLTNLPIAEPVLSPTGKKPMRARLISISSSNIPTTSTH